MRYPHLNVSLDATRGIDAHRHAKYLSWSSAHAREKYRLDGNTIVARRHGSAISYFRRHFARAIGFLSLILGHY